MHQIDKLPPITAVDQVDELDTRNTARDEIHNSQKHSDLGKVESSSLSAAYASASQRSVHASHTPTVAVVSPIPVTPSQLHATSVSSRSSVGSRRNLKDTATLAV